jgi:hypothetical protein
MNTAMEEAYATLHKEHARAKQGFHPAMGLAL